MAFATCSGTSPNIVCTSSGGAISASSAAGAASLTPTLASPYPSSNAVTTSGAIASIAVRLNGVNGNSLENADLLLVAPTGQTFIFQSDAGGFSALSNVTYTVADSAASSLPNSTAVVNGSTYRPANYSGPSDPDTFPPSGSFAGLQNVIGAPPTPSVTSSSPAPTGSATFASRFNGVTAAGAWKLYVVADAFTPGDALSIDSWDLLLAVTISNISTITSVTSSANPVLIPLSGNSTATITATVTAGGNPVTLGTVTFLKGAQELAANVALNGSGQASMTFNTTGAATPVLSEGTHNITAIYSGATGFTSSNGTLSQTVDRATTVTGNNFCNAGTLPLANSPGPATPIYPSKLFVSGLGGTTQAVTMSLRGFSHPSTDNVDLLLVSPTGQKFIPFSYISDPLAMTSGANISLSDLAASTLPSGGAVASGAYRPSHGLSGITFVQASFPAPAPAGPYGNAAPGGSATFASAFSGASPNGTWRLFASSHGSAAAGTSEITSGWCLTFSTSVDPATTTTPTVSPTPSALNQSATIEALVATAATGAPVNAQGAVSFREGSTDLAGPLSLGPDGVASFTKSDLTQGAHFIDAFYGGSPGLFGVSSGQVLHYVDAATTNPSAGQFCNATPLSFPNIVNAPGAPYPTRIQVGGMGGTLQKVTISLNGLTHSFPDDIDMMVTGPNGNSLIAFSDVGGGSAVSALNIILDSTAGTVLPDGTTLASGAFRPADFLVGSDTFAAPAPVTNVASASAVTLSGAFNNSDPNGIWTLWTTNDSAGSFSGPVAGSLSGGWCVNVTMNSPVLTISKTHSGNFVQGQSGQYTVTVGSNGPGSTAGTITVVDTPPAGLTITGMSGSGWSCTVGTGTCTTTSVVPSGGALPAITVTVDVAANATSPRVNSASVSGGGSVGTASANDSTIITAVSDLTVSKTSNSTFRQGEQATYTLTVTNSGAGATTGAFALSDTLPTGLTISAIPTSASWDCSGSTLTVLSCVSTPGASLAAGGSAAAVNMTVSIASNAPPSITNTAIVAGGGEINTSNNSGSLTSSVAALPTVTVNVPAGVQFAFNGQTYTGTQTVQIAPGNYTLATSTPQTLGAGTRAVFSNWSDGGAIAHNVIVGSSPLVITGTFTTQFQLTNTAGTGGTVAPASGTFFDSGNVVNVTATANSGFVFSTWSGPVANASAAATTVTMNAPKSIAAAFTAIPSGPTVVSVRVLFGTQSYALSGNVRNRLPWRVTGLRVTFSEAITSATLNSLTGLTPTAVAGIGTSTLTWTINPVALGNVTTALAGSGPNAITNATGSPLNNGAGATQSFRVLWGDFNDDGVVNSVDTVGVNNARSLPYNVFADANGSGVVDAADVTLVRSRLGATLP